MAVRRDNIRLVLDAFEQGDWDEIHLVTEDIELHLSTAPDGFPAQTWDVSARRQPPPTAALSSQAASPDGQRQTQPADSGAPRAPQAGQGGERGMAHAPGGEMAGAVATGDVTAGAVADASPATEEITAPSPGIFWRSPLPGAPPFTDLGRHVAVGDTLCIVEVMKLMNHIAAHVSGTMTDIMAENGQQVSRGQVLFRIRPDGA